MSKTLEVRGLNKVYQDPGRSVEALRDLAVGLGDVHGAYPWQLSGGMHVYGQIQQGKRGGHPGQLTAGR